MARSQKRRSTAAYAASQPLFDALRIGCERLTEQQNQLSLARDLVQQLHVKLPHATDDGEPEKHRRYVVSTVKAYTAAMQSYADIFESLAMVTAADATEGREQKDGHETFAAMAHSATQARDVALAFDIHADVSQPDDGSGTKKLSRKRTLPDDSISNPASKIQRLSSKAGDNTKSPNTLSGGEDVSHASLHQDSLRKGTAAHRQKNAKEREHLARYSAGDSESASTRAQHDEHAINAKQTLDAGEAFTTLSAFAQHREPNVEYEDVSAEVEERLKAKEEKRRAKDKEKKRKRQSDQSLPDAEVAQKQQQKKTKHGDDLVSGLAKSKANVATHQKRRKQEDGSEGGHKRRKKTK